MSNRPVLILNPTTRAERDRQVDDLCGEHQALYTAMLATGDMPLRAALAVRLRTIAIRLARLDVDLRIHSDSPFVLYFDHLAGR